ncbi:MAG: RND transporter, partial [Pseudomonadota bacterium]|nr:RND transporter [Pseudomonadota bacterium]
MRYKTLLITTILSLSACTVGSDYQKPARELPADFVAADVLQALNVDNANKAVLPLWWQGFHDPVL